MEYDFVTTKSQSLNIHTLGLEFQNFNFLSLFLSCCKWGWKPEYQFTCTVLGILVHRYEYCAGYTGLDMYIVLAILVLRYDDCAGHTGA